MEGRHWRGSGDFSAAPKPDRKIELGRQRESERRRSASALSAQEEEEAEQREVIEELVAQAPIIEAGSSSSSAAGSSTHVATLKDLVYSIDGLNGEQKDVVLFIMKQQAIE